MIYSGPKFKSPRKDFLSWALSRRGYADDDEIYIEAENPSNLIAYKELIYLTKHIARGLRELEGIGQNGAGKDIVMVYSTSEVLPICKLILTFRLCILFQFYRLLVPGESMRPLVLIMLPMTLLINSSWSDQKWYSAPKLCMRQPKSYVNCLEYQARKYIFFVR